MTTDAFTDQLSPYLDSELDPAARPRLEAHLTSCAECRAALAELRAIMAAAPHYAGRAPSPAVWQAIEAHLDEALVLPLRPRARHFTWAHLIAASVAMAVVGGGAGWVISRGRGGPEVIARSPTSVAPAPGPLQIRTAAAAEARYDAAVHDLEQVLAAGRGRLDSTTVRTVEESLRKIDSAISEARAAIQRDPANAYLSRQIAANMRRKLNLLRTATNAIAARS